MINCASRIVHGPHLHAVAFNQSYPTIVFGSLSLVCPGHLLYLSSFLCLSPSRLQFKASLHSARLNSATVSYILILLLVVFSFFSLYSMCCRFCEPDLTVSHSVLLSLSLPLPSPSIVLTLLHGFLTGFATYCLTTLSITHSHPLNPRCRQHVIDIRFQCSFVA